MKSFGYIAAFTVITAAISVSQPALAEGKLLTNTAGKTVYIFDKDASGKSNCSGACATAWPPVTIDSITASPDITAITREDGAKQAAYKNQPLYLFAGDRKPGDKGGNGISGVWHIANEGDAPRAKSKSAAETGSGGY
ncbi:MAG: hypothetical protein V4568_01450 [Pseudomonadota bacterium]